MKTQSKASQRVKKAVEAEQPLITPAPAVKDAQTVPVEQITLDDIRANPMNPRKYFDGDSLANIVEHGVLQPVTVRETAGDDGKGYEIVFGERRYRAARIAGLEKIPCMVRVLDDDKTFDMLMGTSKNPITYPFQSKSS